MNSSITTVIGKTGPKAAQSVSVTGIFRRGRTAHLIMSLITAVNWGFKVLDSRRFPAILAYSLSKGFRKFIKSRGKCF